MKKLLIVALFLASVYDASAQLRFGIKAGPNFANLDGELNTSTRTSFHVGAVIEIKASQKFSIQPELVYSSQGAKVTAGTLTEINYNYMTVPVLVKYYLIADTFSIEAGPQFSFLIEDNVKNTFETKSFDFGAVGGVGINITKSLFVQAHYVIGLSDTSSDANVTNRVIQLSLGYNF